MEKKPQRAEELLKTNAQILFDSDSNSGSYEDDTVVSKDKYDKHKQLTFKKIESETTSVITKNEEVKSEEIDKSQVTSEVKTVVEENKNRQPKIIKYETVEVCKKGIDLIVKSCNKLSDFGFY